MANCDRANAALDVVESLSKREICTSDVERTCVGMDVFGDVDSVNNGSVDSIWKKNFNRLNN